MRIDEAHLSPRTALASVEDARLGLYIDWAEAQIPWWYWPAFALTVAAWIASYTLGTWGGIVGALAAAIVFGTMAGVLARRSGITMPRLRAMPPALRRPVLAVIAVHLAVVAAIVSAGWLIADPPFVLIGAVTGPALALVGAAGARRYRTAAMRLRAQRPTR